MTGALPPDVMQTASPWREIETAPIGQTLIVWGNGGQRFMRQDQRGQWRNMMGHPRPAPKLWAPMLPNPDEAVGRAA